MIQATPAASKGRALTDYMDETVAWMTSFLQYAGISLCDGHFVMQGGHSVDSMFTVEQE